MASYKTTYIYLNRVRPYRYISDVGRQLKNCYLVIHEFALHGVAGAHSSSVPES